MKLSIIIPAFNEALTISLLLDQIKNVELIRGIQKEVIIINDCSSDSTEEVVTSFIAQNPELPINYMKQPVNQGKGAAIASGISLAVGEFIIIQDADLEYDPREYNILLTLILDRQADVVYGSRFMGGRPHRVLFFGHTFGNLFLTVLSNIFSNLSITDMNSCYILFKAEILKSINLREKRFGFNPEVTAKVAKIKGVKIYDVGISYYGRTFNEGKKIGWKDGFRSIYCIIRYNLFS
jgi:glycosyltransferase involved in cell wall biosynthesis